MSYSEFEGLHFMKILSTVFLVFLLSGCGTKTSEIVPAGNDTYFISGHGYAQKAPEAMTALYREANDYCQNRGKSLSLSQQTLKALTFILLLSICTSVVLCPVTKS